MSDLSDFYKQKIKEELKASRNLKEAFDILGKYYELENCKPGFIVKGVLIKKLEEAVKTMNAQPRKQFS